MSILLNMVHFIFCDKYEKYTFSIITLSIKTGFKQCSFKRKHGLNLPNSKKISFLHVHFRLFSMITPLSTNILSLCSSPLHIKLMFVTLNLWMKLLCIYGCLKLLCITLNLWMSEASACASPSIYVQYV